MKLHFTLVLVVTAATLATLAFAPAAPAAAHVTVTPTSVTAGGRATFTFRVPNESADAKTVQLEVVFPENAALTSVSLRPVPGWTATVERHPGSGTPVKPAEDGHASSAEAVTRILWRSDTGVGVGEFQTFDVAVSPLPKQPTTLVFKALQTYSSGEVVRWIDTPEEGAPKPAHPAMVVTVAAAATPVPVAAAADTSSTGGALSWAGLAVAVLALGVALTAARRRQPAPPRAAVTSAGAGMQPAKTSRR